MDTVDDLHAVEDENGVLRGILEQWVEVGERVLGDALGPANLRAVSELVDRSKAATAGVVCRPTCQFVETGGCEEDDPACCGCPCGHEGCEHENLRVGGAKFECVDCGAEVDA